jgi:hypothetical protein
MMLLLKIVFTYKPFTESKTKQTKKYIIYLSQAQVKKISQ